MVTNDLNGIDRLHLRQSGKLAAEARRAPEAEYSPLEPTWAVVIAEGEKTLATAVFLPGDAEDAVEKAARGLAPAGAERTLYITIEPTAVYQRIAPVTESIRRSGIRRVVVGAENPAPKLRGKGLEALRKQGVQAILADGEEARACQLLYEDYTKVMNKGLPALRLFWHWQDSDETPQFPLALESRLPVRADAFLVRWETLEANPQFRNPFSWLIVLDANGEGERNLGRWGEKKVILFTPEGKPRSSRWLNFSVPLRGSHLDLAHVLRKTAELGLFSVLCAGDAPLFSRAISAGLVDSVLSLVRTEQAPADILARMAASPVKATDFTPDTPMRLGSPRVLDQATQDLLIEADVNFANS